MTDPTKQDATHNFDKVRFLVTGAAGHLGSTIMRLLKDAGCEAHGLLRPGENPRVEDERFRYFTGDMRDRESLRPLFENAEDRQLIVIHTAAIISIAKRMPSALHAVNVDGVRNILALCQENAVCRLVHVSSVHAIPELPNGLVMREPSSFSPDAVIGGYAKTKAEAAQLVLDAAASGLDAVIVFPSGILGPYDEGGNHLIQLVADYLDGKLPACVAGGYDFVDVRDVAQGCLLAAERGRAGEGYILSGHYLSIKKLLDTASSISGNKKTRVIPTWLAQAAVPFVELDARIHGTRPLFTGYSLHTLNVNGRFSSEKAQRELGYTARDPRETVADMIAWLRSHKRARS